MEIEGAAALVTGAASGLGLATAQMLKAAGAKVALLDLEPTRIEAAAHEVGGLGLACDVGDATAAERAVAAAIEAHGAPAVLVNCAGVAPAERIVGKGGAMPLAAFERVVRVNLLGTFNLLRLAAAAMAARPADAGGERGVIVNTASISAFEGQIGQSAYAASKAGVVGLTLPAARELARHGIRVVAIAPGVFATPMVQAMPAPVQEALAASVPFPPRLGEPAAFARLVREVVENPMLNGCTLRLDGALRMAPR